MLAGLQHQIPIGWGGGGVDLQTNGQTESNGVVKDNKGEMQKNEFSGQHL